MRIGCTFRVNENQISTEPQIFIPNQVNAVQAENALKYRLVIDIQIGVKPGRALMKLDGAVLAAKRDIDLLG
jgi:hypothetical protein